jgi:hypothetical protein
MTWLDVAVAALAVWRVTHLLVHEDGPGGAVARLRAVAGRLPGGSPLTCFYCASVWVAGVPAWWVGRTPTERSLLLPGLSGAAILVQRWLETRVDAGPPPWIEDPPVDPEPLHPEPLHPEPRTGARR